MTKLDPLFKRSPKKPFKGTRFHHTKTVSAWIPLVLHVTREEIRWQPPSPRRVKVIGPSRAGNPPQQVKWMDMFSQGRYQKKNSKSYPWTPKPWKMKVLHPKLWVINVITTKNEGFGFPMAGICFFRRFVTVLSKDFECSFWCHLGQVTGRPTSPRPHGCPGPFPLSTPWCLPNAPDWASKKPCFFNQTYHGYDKYISIVDIKLYIYNLISIIYIYTFSIYKPHTDPTAKPYKRYEKNIHKTYQNLYNTTTSQSHNRAPQTPEWHWPRPPARARKPCRVFRFHFVHTVFWHRFCWCQWKWNQNIYRFHSVYLSNGMKIKMTKE